MLGAEPPTGAISSPSKPWLRALPLWGSACPCAGLLLRAGHGCGGKREGGSWVPVNFRPDLGQKASRVEGLTGGRLGLGGRPLGWKGVSSRDESVQGDPEFD